MSTALENLLARFPSAQKNGAEWKALCPAHADRNPSLSITEKDGTILLHCFAGCNQDAVLTAAGIEPKELFSRNGNARKDGAPGPIVETYDYADEKGGLVYQVTRHEPKDFRVRRRNGSKGAWISNINGIPRVLYNLQGVIASERVFIVEGEKDANTAERIGLVATTNVFGANAKWTDAYSETLRNKDVTIIADADPTGREHAKEVATSLHLRARSIKIIEMPGKKDLSEWVESMSGAANAEVLRRQVLALAADAPDWKPLDAADENEPANWREVFHSLEEFENAQQLSFAIEGFLQNHGSTVIAGLSGHGKTFLMLSVIKALLVGVGAKLWNLFPVLETASRILYLIPECALTPFKHRLLLMGLYDYLASDRLLVRTLSKGTTLPLSDPRILYAARGAHVILDTVSRFAEGDENSASDNQRGLASDIFALVGAGARSVLGAHHSPKSFARDNGMSLESVLRGSGDLGAMLSTAWGIKQLDATQNIIHIENIKPRDFQPCGPFQIIGRPWIDQEGDFRLLKRPGECGRLEEELTVNESNQNKRRERLERVGMVKMWLKTEPNLSAPEVVERFAANGISVNEVTVRKYRIDARRNPL